MTDLSGSYPRQKHIVTVLSSAVLIAGLLLFLVASFVASRQFISGVLNQLGSLLLITGLFTLLYEYKLRRLFIIEMREEIRGTLRYFLDASSDFQASGLLAYYQSLPDSELYEEFRKVDSVQILQTWTGMDTTIDEPLRSAIKNGCKVRVLLLDPDKKFFCEERGKDLEIEDLAFVSSQIKNNLTMFKRIVDDVQGEGNIEVRLYDATPTIPMYICGETIYFGHMWKGAGRYSARTPYFKARKLIDGSKAQSTFGRLVEYHFESLWKKRSRPYAQSVKHGTQEEVSAGRKMQELGE